MFTSFEQIRKAQFNFQRIAKEEEYRKYWANDRTSPVLKWDINDKGESQRGAGTELNWFRRITEFYVGALVQELPTIASEDERVDKILKQNLANYVEEIEKAVRWRSMKGLGVFAFLDDYSISTIDTSHYFEVVDETDLSKVTGHMLVYPWSSREHMLHLYDDKGPGTKNRSLIHEGRAQLDRIDIVEVENGKRSERFTYTFNGSTAGELIKKSKTMIKAVATIGDWISDYVDVLNPILRLENRMYRLDRSLDRHSSPHLQGPAELLNSNEDGENTIVIDEEGQFFPVPEDGQPYSYLTWDSGMAGAYQQIEELKSFIFIASGVSPSAFGLDEAGISGVARERQMLVALQKIRKLKRGIDKALTEGFSYSDMKDITIDWPEDPFATRTERIDEIIKLHDAGLMDTDTAKEKIDGLKVSY